MYIISPFTNQTGGVERHAKFIYETFKKKYNLILIEPKLVSNLNFKYIKTLLNILFLLFKIPKNETCLLEIGNIFYASLIIPLKFRHNTIISFIHMTPTHRSLNIFFLRKFLIFLLNMCNKNVVVSKYMLDKFVEFGLKVNKVNLIYNSVTCQKRSYISKKKIVLYFGRLSKEKGVSFLLDTAKLLKDYKFVIVGEGPERYNLEMRLKKENISNVEFKGYLDEKYLINLIKISKYCVFPSLSESFPYVVLEAMSYGKPVIVTPVGGILEIVKHEKNGILIEPKNVNEIVSAIKRLDRDYNLFYRISKNSRLTIKNNFSKEIINKKLEALFNEYSNKY